MKKRNLLKRVGSLVICGAMVCGLVACGGSGDSAEDSTTASEETTTIQVAAAASLQATFDNVLIPMFEEANPGIKVEGTYASSGDLQQQIEAGLEADVFMSAATSNMDTLVEEGLIDADTVVNLLRNDVVVIVPEGIEAKVTGFQDLDKADVVAIGDPESVPAGKYAKEILTNLGIYDAVAEKASFGTDVTSVCTQVAEGSADAGIVYSTDALGENNNGDDRKVTVLDTATDDMMDTPVIYPVAVTSSSTHKEEAQAFEEFLQTQEALEVFEQNGFTINIQ